MALTVSGLRATLTAAIGPEAGAYVDGLKARGLLPRDEAQTPLNADAGVIALLAMICIAIVMAEVAQEHLEEYLKRPCKCPLRGLCPAPSTPWSWKTCFERSMPMVLMWLMDGFLCW
jgi:hypothetical protein